MRAFLLLMAAICISGCSSSKYNVVSNPEVKFNPDGLVVIIKERRDPLELQDELEHRLNKIGFSVKAQMFSDCNSGEEKRVKAIGARYVLQYSYHNYKSFLLGIQSFDTFSAVLKDHKTGKTIFSFSFRGGKSVSSVLDELDDNMKNLLR